MIGLGNEDDFLIHLKWRGTTQEYAVCIIKNKNVSIIKSIESDFENYQIQSVSPLSEKRFLVYLDKGINIFCYQKNNIYYSEIFTNIYCGKYYNPDVKRIYGANDIIIICIAIERIENDCGNFKRPPT